MTRVPTSGMNFYSPLKLKKSRFAFFFLLCFFLRLVFGEEMGIFTWCQGDSVNTSEGEELLASTSPRAGEEKDREEGAKRGQGFQLKTPMFCMSLQHSMKLNRCFKHTPHTKRLNSSFPSPEMPIKTLQLLGEFDPEMYKM